MRYAIMFPGSDVRGLADARSLGAFGRYGDGPYDVGNSIQMKAKMEALVDSLASTWAWAKAQIKAGNYVASLIGVDTSISGLQTIDNVIALKRKSIGDVLGEQLSLDKWVNGMQVAREEIEHYVAYVNSNASAMANLRQLGTDLTNTAKEYARTAGTALKVAAGLSSAAIFGLTALAGVILWKAGPDILRAWTSPPRFHGLRGHGRRRTSRRARHGRR